MHKQGPSQGGAGRHDIGRLFCLKEKKWHKGGSEVGYFHVRASGFRDEIKEGNHFVQNNKGVSGDFLKFLIIL